MRIDARTIFRSDPMMSEIQFGVGITQSFTAGELAGLGQICEDLGYSQLWYANHKLSRDLYVGLSWLAAHTKHISLGTFIAEPYSYHPAMIAAAVGTLDELSGGRAILLLGAGAANFGKLGLQRRMPVGALRETIQICRSLLGGEQLTFRGKYFEVEGARLDFVVRSHLPIYVAARGHKMLEVAGEWSDGVMVATHATPAGLQTGLSPVEIGCRRASRTCDTLPIFTRVDLSLDDDANAARERVRPAIAQFLTASYPDRRFVNAVGLEVPAALEQICSKRDDDLARRSGHLVPDPFIDAFTWAGTAAQIAEKIAAVVDYGIPNITFVPQPSAGAEAVRIIKAFAVEVMPRIRVLIGGRACSRA